MTNDIKNIAPKVVELIAREVATQAKNATSVNNISVKLVKEKFLKLLSEEVSKALPDK